MGTVLLPVLPHLAFSPAHPRLAPWPSPSRLNRSTLIDPFPVKQRPFYASYRWYHDDDEDPANGADVSDNGSFDRGVSLFNSGDYYKCHDVLESLWHRSQEPQRSVVHGILQCAVGLHHLLHQNHRGAMTELGEGLTKLRKKRFTEGPFQQFEQEMSEVLEYIYNTQLEHAACSDDLCITMDGSQQSYQLLGNFAAGKLLYRLHRAEDDQLFLLFLASEKAAPLKVKVPSLNMTGNDLCRLR